MLSSPFKPGYRSGSTMALLPYPTNDTRIIIDTAVEAAKRIYHPATEYLKAGVGLVDIEDRQPYQADLLHPGQSQAQDKVMRMGDGMICHQSNADRPGTTGIDHGFWSQKKNVV
jgi:DNA polymerase V